MLALPTFSQMLPGASAGIGLFVIGWLIWFGTREPSDAVPRDDDSGPQK